MLLNLNKQIIITAILLIAVIALFQFTQLDISVQNFFYNFDDQDNKFVEIIDYISEGEKCEIIQCDGGKLFERKSNS